MTCTETWKMIVPWKWLELFQRPEPTLVASTTNDAGQTQVFLFLVLVTTTSQECK
jgi:hypothetical protein